jgi:hypothetical protein
MTSNIVSVFSFHSIICCDFSVRGYLLKILKYVCVRFEVFMVVMIELKMSCDFMSPEC